MDADTIRTYAEIGTAVGTFALALATFKFAADASRQAKRDRITKEMDFLISPLMIAYREIESRGKDGDWWILYFGDLSQFQTDQIAAQRFREAVKSIDQYKYLAPERLRILINEFVLRLKDMERGEDPGNLHTFRNRLIEATNNLYYGTNVMGGLVEHRYYELTQGLDALNKDLISKTRDLFAKIKSWLHLKRKPPKSIHTGQLVV